MAYLCGDAEIFLPGRAAVEGCTSTPARQGGKEGFPLCVLKPCGLEDTIKIEAKNVPRRVLEAIAPFHFLEGYRVLGRSLRGGEDIVDSMTHGVRKVIELLPRQRQGDANIIVDVPSEM